MRIAAGALFAAALISACEEPSPTSPAERAVRERPVITLKNPVAQHEMLLIPRGALIERAGITGVFVLSDKGEARFRLVKPGRVRGERVEVVSGLVGTETLVLGDLKDVHDGTPIRPR